MPLHYWVHGYVIGYRLWQQIGHCLNKLYAIKRGILAADDSALVSKIMNFVLSSLLSNCVHQFLHRSQ